MAQRRKTTRKTSRSRRPRGASKQRSARPRTKAQRSSATRKTATRRWSHRVMETSDALDLEPAIFRRGTARQIALSLKRSAERSERRKSAPFRSAMSMLNFYINRGGKNLSPTRRRVLERAKDELRDVFHRA
ncbi:MAG TPA: DUF3175 domain-containing protein [Polyangiaceae bacterium]|nr:DUF3175 domain-containing protein [Polyangiaceae bacterium]